MNAFNELKEIAAVEKVEAATTETNTEETVNPFLFNISDEEDNDSDNKNIVDFSGLFDNISTTVEPEELKVEPEEVKVEAVADKNKEVKVEEPDLEVKESTVEEEVKTEEEKLETEEPKKKRKRKTKKEKIESEEEQSKEPDFDSQKIFKSDMTAEEMIAYANDYFLEDDWQKRYDEIEERLVNIRIEVDMNVGTLFYVTKELSDLRDEIFSEHNSLKAAYSNLTDKETGLIAIYKNIYGVGSNEAERKRNAYKELTQVRQDPTAPPVNYLALLCSVRTRFNFLDGIVNRIKEKHQMCITLSAGLKLEQQMDNMTKGV